MSTPLALLDLIARLEAAPEGGLELSEAIARWFSHNHYEWWRKRSGPSNFTESLDAARTLVPANAGWQAGADHNGGQATAELAWQRKRGEAILSIEVSASTPALALCIACLRVRQQ